MIDWPTWVEEGLIDALHPRFWIIDPGYVKSYPNSTSGSWHVSPNRIAQEKFTIKQTIGNRCKLYGTVLCKHDGPASPIEELTPKIIESAKAIIESGSDGVGIYTDDQIMATDEFWSCLHRIHQGQF